MIALALPCDGMDSSMMLEKKKKKTKKTDI
jgi:hypothetical protein